MAKQNKLYTDDELQNLMNTTGALSEIDDDEIDTIDNDEINSESESDGEIDELETELLYDSDDDVEYFPIPDEDSSDEDGEEVSGVKRKKQKRKVVASTPAKRRAPRFDFTAPSTSDAGRATSAAPTASTSDASHFTAPSTSDEGRATSAAPTASTSDASRAPSPAATRGRTRRRCHRETSSVVTFNSSTLASVSQFRWS